MTIPATGLFVAPCSREAALWAVRCWHYSRTLAAGRCLYWGVWFDGVFIGVVAVARGLREHRSALRLVAEPDSRGDAYRARIRARRACFSGPRDCGPIAASIESRARGAHQLQRPATRSRRPRRLWRVRLDLPRRDGSRSHAVDLRPRGYARTISSKFGTRDLQWLRANVDPQARRIDCRNIAGRWRSRTPMRDRLNDMAQPYPKRERSAESGTLDALQRGRCDTTRSLLSAEVACVG